MAFPLSLPSRPRKVRARMALDDGSPDFTLPKLAAWCATNMSRQEILDFIDSLRDLAANSDAEDEENTGIPNLNNVRAGKIGGALQQGSRQAQDEYQKMFPNAGRLKA
jgi:hypothetical protein